MKKNLKTTALIAHLFFAPLFVFGWGEEGHKMVADIAQKNLKKGVEANVQKYLGAMTFQQAATWMDDVRSDHSLDYMKPWHYVNIEKDSSYRPNPKGDATSELQTVIAELKNYKKMKDEDVAKDLKILFHLCGDIAQPLHAGYGSDKGGNDVEVSIGDKKVRLHHVWDTDIIVKGKITTETCLLTASKLKKKQLKAMQKIDPKAWMMDSRSYLPQVYNIQNATITDDYINANKAIVEMQLIKGGERLAAVLNSIFK